PLMIEIHHEGWRQLFVNRRLLDGYCRFATGVGLGGLYALVLLAQKEPGARHGKANSQQHGKNDDDDQLHFACGLRLGICRRLRCVFLSHANNPSLFGVLSAVKGLRASVMPVCQQTCSIRTVRHLKVIRPRQRINARPKKSPDSHILGAGRAQFRSVRLATTAARTLGVVINQTTGTASGAVGCFDSAHMQLLLRSLRLTGSTTAASATVIALTLPAATERLIGDVHVQLIHALLS